MLVINPDINQYNYGEVWQGEYDSDRRVDILFAQLSEHIPGLKYCTGYIINSKNVMATFYVPKGYSLKTAAQRV